VPKLLNKNTQCLLEHKWINLHGKSSVKEIVNDRLICGGSMTVKQGISMQNCTTAYSCQFDQQKKNNKKSFVRLRKSFVLFKKSFVRFKKSFVRLRKSFVRFKKSFVRFKNQKVVCTI
jgi:hypothetical protein